MNVEARIGMTATTSGADDELRISVSALVDDELDEATIDRTIDALLASDELARFWADAHRAGDWMRSDEVVGVGDCEKSLQRFAVALAGEPAIVAPGALRHSRARRFWVRTGLPGASVAAALVVVAWVAMPVARNDGKPAATEIATVVVTKAPQQEPLGAVQASANLATIDASKLDEYFTAHRDVSPFSYRGAAVRPASLDVPAATTPIVNAQ